MATVKTNTATDPKVTLMLRTLVLSLLILVGTPVMSQNPIGSGGGDFITELRARNVDVTELQRRLEIEGIVLDELSSSEIATLRPRIEQIVNLMQAERKMDTIRPPNPPSNIEVSEAPQDSARGRVLPREVQAKPESTIYGHNIFRNRSLQVFEAGANARPPANYPLQSGDALAVNIFGASQSNFLLTVGQDGFVRLPNSLQINLLGVPLNQAKRLLKQRLRQFYSFGEGQISIEVQQTQSVSVSIFGEVENNGTYTMSSVNTAFNALVAAGGATEIGTVRNIQVINGAETVEIDVYEYLRNPKQTVNAFVQNGMTIYVPTAKTLVDVRGSVQRPMKYELKDGETISDLLAFAGGSTVRAETGAITVTRYVSSVLRIINVDLNVQDTFVLNNGDIVQIPEITNPIVESVSIGGAVLLPGSYAFEAGMTVGTLITEARLRPGARDDAAFLFRKRDDGSVRLIKLDIGAGAGAMEEELLRGDSLQILAQATFLDQATVTIGGAVRQPGQLPYPAGGGLSLEEAILLSGGLEQTASREALIIRTPLYNTEERQYLRTNLSAANEMTLQPGDEIRVYQRERFTDVFDVKITGAVRDTGTYRYDPSLGFDDLFILAGGFKRSAATDKIDVFRLETRGTQPTATLTTTLILDSTFNIVSSSDPNFELRPFDIIAVRSIPGFEPIRTVTVEGQVRYPGVYALNKPELRLTDVIQMAGGLTEAAFSPGSTLFRPDSTVGFIVIHLDEALDNNSVTTNIVLKDGDLLTVPRARDLVSINTQNTNANDIYIDSLLRRDRVNVAFDGRHDAKWYIENYAAGYSDNAWKRSTTVEYPNGEVKATKRFLFFNTYPVVRPGSIVSISQKPLRKQPRVRNENREKVDWGRFARDTIAIATSTLSLILLTQRL